MMRLDKFLSHAGNISRADAKKYLKSGAVEVNGSICKDGAALVDEAADSVSLLGKTLSYSRFRYYVLHKPAGVVTASKDARETTVMDLLAGTDTRNVSPVGRLDKDTEGLLLLTDDGELAHRLLSPAKHVDKTYLVHTRSALTPEALKKLEEGVDIGDDRPTLPASAKLLEERKLLLTIREGRYHQIKRMLAAVDNEVEYLKRLSMGPLALTPDLAAGEFRALTGEEIQALYQETGHD